MFGILGTLTIVLDSLFRILAILVSRLVTLLFTLVEILGRSITTTEIDRRLGNLGRKWRHL